MNDFFLISMLGRKDENNFARIYIFIITKPISTLLVVNKNQIKVYRFKVRRMSSNRSSRFKNSCGIVNRRYDLQKNK